jgi:putative endonuclease
MKTKINTKTIGQLCENIACDFLIEKGYKILHRNFYAKKFGEIDIIAFKDDIYHFVEVKSGNSFEAIYNITPRKLQKLYKSINYFLKLHKLENRFYCLDAIVCCNNQIEFIQNITI